MTQADESTLVRLTEALRKGAPELGVETVGEIERLTSGLSSQSYRVEAVTSSGPVTWVMRVEPEFGVIPPYDIAREFRLLGEVGAAGLPVPRALHLGEDASVVGGRFMLMSFVEGQIYRSQDARLAADPELQAGMQAHFVETLARIHDTPQNVFPRYRNGPEATRALIAICRDRMERTELMVSPLLRHALDVLDERAPEAQRLVLLHGDYRLPNLIWQDGRIAGILDWELATFGDPLSDLAFTQTIGRGPCSIEGPLAEQYAALTGIEIEPRKIVYYRLLEMVKSCIIGLAGAHDLAMGGSDLRLLSVATLALSGQPMFGVLEEQLESFLEA